ncbi:MAG: hypothetical protein AAFN41_01205 [Planctomycetota bacterium]
MQDQNNPYSHDAQQAPAQAVPGQPSYSPAGKLIRPCSYPPQTFKSLYTWWLILLIAGVLLTIILIGIPLIIAAVIVFYVFLYKGGTNSKTDRSGRLRAKRSASCSSRSTTCIGYSSLSTG